jgi:type IV fimbrial biogenesis protein FimT
MITYAKAMQQGFTLMEILVTISIASLLMTLGVPAMRNALENHRAFTLSREFVAMVAYTRSEAITRKQPVSFCAAADVNLTNCASTGGFVAGQSWNNGWLVFIDGDSDGIVDTGEEILKVQPPLSHNDIFNSIQRVVTYDDAGFPTAGTGSFTVEPAGCSGTNGKLVTISPAGRPTIADHTCS